jgi:hypothetical protein
MIGRHGHDDIGGNARNDLVECHEVRE